MPDFDLDDIFAYRIARRVVIRHRLLGLTRWAIILALIGYVVVYEVIFNKGYLKKDEPFGFTTVSLRRQGWEDIAAQQQCCGADGCGTCSNGLGCESWTRPGTCQLEGCTWTSSASLRAFDSDRGRLECVEWDRYNVLKPYSEEFSSLITTRVTHIVSDELPVACITNATSASCPSWTAASKKSYYTTGIEDMTVLVDHGVYGRETNRIVRSQEMRSAVVVDGNENKLFSICGGGNNDGRAASVNDVETTTCNDAEASRPGDIMTIRQILEAAGIPDLDTKVPAPHNTTDTRRYDGVVVLVVIRYDGTGVDTRMHYTFSMYPLEGLEYKFEEVQYQWLPSGGVVRHIYNRHGLRLIFASRGYVTEFSFPELVKTMMIAMGLMSAAKFVVEVIILRLHKNSGVYARYRDVKTVDFSDYTHEGLKNLDDMDYSLGCVRNGTKEAEEQKLGEKLDQKLDELKEKLGGDSESEGDVTASPPVPINPPVQTPAPVDTAAITSKPSTSPTGWTNSPVPKPVSVGPSAIHNILDNHVTPSPPPRPASAHPLYSHAPQSPGGYSQPYQPLYDNDPGHHPHHNGYGRNGTPPLGVLAHNPAAPATFAAAQPQQPLYNYTSPPGRAGMRP